MELLEKKIDDIHVLLQSGHQPDGSPSGTFPSNLSRSPPDTPLQHLTQPNLVNFPSSISLIKPIIPHDVVGRGIISLSDAEELVEMYRSESKNYPFITLPLHAHLDTLRSDRPCLFLSVMAMASQRDPALQLLLEQEFRELLSTRAIIEGEKSLDLLQGLLVYLAW